MKVDFFTQWKPQQGVVEEISEEEEGQIPDYRDPETEGLIREYQKNPKPTPS